MTKKIQVILIVILAIVAISLIRSQSADPSDETSFKLKRAQEQVFLKLKNDPREKVMLMSSMLSNRLDEVSSVVNSKKYDYLLKASLRYSTLAGQITDLIVINNLKDLADGVKKQFADHKKKLYDLYVIYPKNTDNLEYKYIEDDMNYLDLYLDKLSKV